MTRRPFRSVVTFLPSGPRGAWATRAAGAWRAVRRLGALALVAAATFGAAACSEQLSADAGCPSLCPQQRADELRDTVVTGVVVDSTIGDFPLFGDVQTRLVAVAPGPDSLDVRYVVRFDSLPARFFPTTGGDSVAIARVDRSALRLRLDTAGTRFTQPLTIELFDVDTAAAVDTVAAALNARFRADRRIGTITIAPATFGGDSLDVPVTPARVVAAAGGRLRVGVRISSSAPARLRLRSAINLLGGTDITNGPRLVFRALETDTTGTSLITYPSSATPSPNDLARTVVEQTIVARSPRTALGQDLVIGGLPAKRAFIRFDLPRRITDSTSLVRATLVLTQRAAPGFASTDTVVLIPQAVYSTSAVTDLLRVAAFATRGVTSPISASIPLDSVAVIPTASGRVELPLAGLVRQWRFLSTTAQRALVIRAAAEGLQAGEARFVSNEGAADLRPRLLLTYLPSNPTNGLP